MQAGASSRQFQTARATLATSSSFRRSSSSLIGAPPTVVPKPHCGLMREALERHELRRLVDAAACSSEVLELGRLAADEAEHDAFAPRQEAQRREIAGALAVVFEQEDDRRRPRRRISPRPARSRPSRSSGRGNCRGRDARPTVMPLGPAAQHLRCSPRCICRAAPASPSPIWRCAAGSWRRRAAPAARRRAADR